MSPKMKFLLLQAMAMGAMAESAFRIDSHSNPMEYPYGNAHKKCHRPNCGNFRNGNALYCSAECCKMDKERIKQLNKQ